MQVIWTQSGSKYENLRINMFKPLTDSKYLYTPKVQELLLQLALNTVIGVPPWGYQSIHFCFYLKFHILFVQNTSLIKSANWSLQQEICSVSYSMPFCITKPISDSKSNNKKTFTRHRLGIHTVHQKWHKQKQSHFHFSCSNIIKKQQKPRNPMKHDYRYTIYRLYPLALRVKNYSNIRCSGSWPCNIGSQSLSVSTICLSCKAKINK